MTIDKALSKLYSLHQFGIKLGLQNITDLLDYLGNPHEKLRSFHIAGSNGKGSTVAFIASILMEAGYKVGIYTSPHFVRFNERIRINTKEISDEEITEFVGRLDDYIDRNSPTFFELTTALAFEYFARNDLDYCVIETGLGGRLDATNVLLPLASVITSIGFEHTNILGDSIEKIAYEKGGIIKNGARVFLGHMNEGSKRVLSRLAEEKNCELTLFEDHIDFGGDRSVLRYGDLNLNIYSTPLRGSHQIINSSLASVAVAGTIGLTDGKTFIAGIKNVIGNTGIQGRYEIYSEAPRIIFDSAHNLDGVKVFRDEFDREKHKYKKKILIFGVMQDKDIKNMIINLSDSFDEIYFTEISYERSAKARDLIDLASELGIRAALLQSPVQYIIDFKESDREKDKPNNQNCLAVLGSIYLLGTIKEDLMKKSS